MVSAKPFSKIQLFSGVWGMNPPNVTQRPISRHQPLRLLNPEQLRPVACNWGGAKDEGPALRTPRLIPVGYRGWVAGISASFPSSQNTCPDYGRTPMLRWKGAHPRWVVGRSLDGVHPSRKGLVDPGVEVPVGHVVVFVDHCSVGIQHVQVGVLGEVRLMATCVACPP